MMIENTLILNHNDGIEKECEHCNGTGVDCNECLEEFCTSFKADCTESVCKMCAGIGILTYK